MLNTYIEVRFADGTKCTCEPKDVPDMTEGAEGFTVREVQMTPAEFEAMPEFQG